jgi:hypothetical protein
MTNDPDRVGTDDAQVDAPHTGGAAEPADEETTRVGDDGEERPEGELDGEPEEGLDEEEATGRGSSRWAAPVAVWIAIILIGLGVFALLRVAGEQRYQSCVAAASARSQGATDALTRFARQRAIQRCSHSPF